MSLWDSKVPGFITENYRQSKRKAEAMRLLEMQMRLDMLENDWKDVVEAKLKERFTNKVIKRMIPAFATTEHNPIARIVELVARIYKWGATRELQDKHANDIAQDLWNEAQIDESLALANKRWVGLGDAIIFPIVADRKLRYDIWTGEATSIVQHPDDPSQCIAAWHEEAPCHSPGITQITKTYVDAEVWRIYDQHGVVLDERYHGLNRFPGVVVHDEKRTGGRFWGDHTYKPVAEATVNVSCDMFKLERITHYQSEIQPYFTGDRKKLALKQGIGAEFLLVGPEGSTFGTLDTQADPSGLIEVINQRLKWIAGQFDVDAELYLNVVTATSGIHMRFKRAPLEARRVADLKIARRLERELLILTALVTTADHPTLKLDPMDAEFKRLDFHEEPMTEDPKTQRDIWERDLKLAQTDHAEIARERNPDLTPEQAMEFVEEKLTNQAAVDKIRIEHNLSADPSVDNQTPEQNGRDGAAAKRDNAAGGNIAADAEKALRKVRA